MDLKKLKSDVIEKIRSSFSINTVSHCVTELVLNSLDAKSTAIAVRVNLVTFKIQVVDNGDGILEKNMPLLGSRYFTNKCKNLEELEQYMNHYGFRGEAIASITECSKSVNITSRHYTSIYTYSRTLGKHSVELKKTKSRPSVGTTVTIEGFFHNFPVRRKRVIAELELEELKREIESLIILHPDVTFSVRNDVECDLILNSHKSKDLISSFKQIHPNLGDDFSLMKISKNKLTIDALFYKNMSENKNIQYIYVNKRPIISSKIQKLIRNLFKKNQKVDRKNPIAALTKYPVFVINIKCPVSKVDIFFNSTKTMVEFENWDLIHRSINKLVNSFFGNNKNLKKTEKFPDDEEFKRDCGVSQIFGAHRRFGYKRKSEDERNEMGNIYTEVQNVINIPKKISNNTFETENNAIIVSKKCTQENNPKGSQIVVDDEENLHISDTTPLQKDFRSHKEFKKFKKPLAITLYKEKMRKNIEDLLPEKQDDMKSSISKFTNDQNKGKNLIMDMFLKSTQIYNSDNKPDRLYGSQETIYEEESNFQMENNYRSEFNGMSNTMSISVNVKSTRRIRKRKERKERFSNKYVQTDMVGRKIVSKSVQTIEHKEYKKINNENRRSMDRLKSTMNSNNYTVFLSDSGEKFHLKFGDKKFLEDYIEPKKVDITQKCHCSCHAACKNRIFNFEVQKKYRIGNLVERKIETPRMDSTVSYLLSKQEHENLPNRQSINQKAPNRFTFVNWNFQVEKKEKTFHNYERSPYFPTNRYSRNNSVSCQQHPQYLINRYNTDFSASSVPPHLNLRHPLGFNEKKSEHNPMHPLSNPSNYSLENPRLAKNKRHPSLRQLFGTTINSTIDCTAVARFKEFKPVQSSTQENDRNDWKNSSIAHFNYSNLDTRKDWTIDSFGQFKPYLFSTQKNGENDCQEKQNLPYTPSRVEKGYLVSNSLMDILNDAKENVDDVESCVSNSIDEKLNEVIEQKHSNLSKQKTQEILEQEFEAEKDLIAKEFFNWDSQFTQEFGNDWLKKINKGGNCYYMNKKSGFTTFHTPVLVEKQFKFGKRFDFMPKGMSPILTETKHVDKSLSQHGKDTLLEYIMESYKSELLYIKWQHYLCDVAPNVFFKNLYEEKLKIFEGFVPNISTTKKNKNRENVISFTKDLFANIEVIGQLDRKFIVVLEKVSNLLVLFDQHAIHERIRLEELIKKYDGAKSNCVEKITFFVPQNELTILKNHESYLNYLGFSVEFFANGLNISTVPLCLFSKFSEDMKQPTRISLQHSGKVMGNKDEWPQLIFLKSIFSDNLNKILQLLVREIIEHLKSTRGVHLKSMPRLLQNIVNLEACRGAIKFGDGLNKDRCEELLVQLSSCDFPFQCAHGRPTLAPLLVLELNEKKIHSKLNFHKLKPST